MQLLAISITLVLMGRPVFHDTSIAELQAASEYVLEVERAATFTASRTNPEGCEEQLWRVVVKDVLSAGKAAAKPPAVDSTIEVIVNPTGLFDCMARKKKPGGVSFSASRYTPSADSPGNRFLVFVRSGARGYVMATQNGWDTLEKKSALAR
jgi:hypothetical protein